MKLNTESSALPFVKHFRVLLLLCLLGPCVAWSFEGIGVKLGFIDKKELQTNMTYVESTTSKEVIKPQPQLLSKAEPAITSVNTTDHLYHKQILIYCLIGVSILFLIFATLYCYEVNKEYSLETERSLSFSAPSQSTLNEVAISMKDLNEAEEL